MLSVILSGGENRRFPHTKGFIEIEGKRIIERNLEVFASIGLKSVISTNEPEKYFYLGVPLIGDVVRRAGPISGIYSAFTATGADEIFASACDMPFLKADVIKRIIADKGGDATVPMINGRPEPLLAVYSRRVLGKIEGMLSENDTSLQRLISECGDTRFVEESKLREIDPKAESFININTPEDYERVFNNKPAGLMA